jgi:hypothetical protein
MADQEIGLNESKDASAADVPSSADQVRRKLIKAGAIGAPLAISLQSGPAWAVASYCAGHAENDIPSDAIVNSTLEDSDALKLIKTHTGIKKSIVLGKSKLPGIIDETSVPGPFPAPDSGGTVNSEEVLWLLVNGGVSCWVSYCDTAIVPNGTVSITGYKSDEVCVDVDGPHGGGGDSGKGDSGKGDTDSK